MVEKNICQNELCCNNRTKDRWNKKLGVYQSRKAYFKPDNKTTWGYSCKMLEYFCTTRCANEWLETHLDNIIERQHAPKKITEKIIRQSESN
tara:strand:+ start:1009 stop:1284 length:276 start_codon:yes stop_codon:yes gene_type:complete